TRRIGSPRPSPPRRLRSSDPHRTCNSRRGRGPEEVDMALFEDMLKGGSLTGIAVGLGAVMLAPTLLPAIGKALRPAAKQVLKSGMVLYRNTLGELGEATSDLVAEVRGELQQAEAA